ncbi:MAG: alpha amylase N-terminal ig-like domain-containing protein [Promethearchaeota archaeon]
MSLRSFKISKYAPHIMMVMLILSSFGIVSSSSTEDLQLFPKSATFDNNVEWDYVLHDSRNGFYRNPGWGTTSGAFKTGAVPVGQDITIRIRTGANDVTQVILRYWNGMAGTETFLDMVVGDTHDGYDFWEIIITSPTEPNDFYYGFDLIDGTDTDYYHDDNSDGGVGKMYGARNTDQDWGIVFYDLAFETPDWHKHTVGYQIFTDRYFNGDTANDAVGDGSSGDITWWEWKNQTITYPRVYVETKEWGETPGGGNDFFGGDLSGVEQKADYLSDLGIGMIWFNPFSESPDNHGYSVNNYTSIQPYYGVIGDRTDGIVTNDQSGSLAVFASMESTLEDAGIRVIYDAVINHASAQSYLFQRFDTSLPGVIDLYPDLDGAFENPGSPYRQTFDFSYWPTEYDSWWGFDNIPTIIYDNLGSVAEEQLITGDSSLFTFWQTHGVDGFRLDVPNMYRDGHESREINQRIRETVKTNNPDDIIIGEIWGRANAWVTGTMHDGVQNMGFRENTRDWLRGYLADEIYSGRLIYPQENYPSEAFYSQWTILGNHDTARILTELGDDVDLLLMAAGLQFTYPGVPMVYYGDEVGMTGGQDPGCRQTYPWGSENLIIQDHYKTLIAMRNDYEVFQKGSFEFLPEVADDIIAYKRELSSPENSTAISIFNRGENSQTVSFSTTDFPYLSPGDQLLDILSNTSVEFPITSEFSVQVPPKSSVILVHGIPIPSDEPVDDEPVDDEPTDDTPTNDDTTDDTPTDDGTSSIPMQLTWGLFFTLGIVMVLYQRQRHQ